MRNVRLTVAERTWITGTDTGLSSLSIFSAMTGLPFEAVTGETVAPTPSDPSDFGRCYRLLQTFPAWRTGLDEVGDLSPAWAALVSAWGEMEALYVASLPAGPGFALWYRLTELTAGIGGTSRADVAAKLDSILRMQARYSALREVGRMWVSKQPRRGGDERLRVRVERVDDPQTPDPKMHVFDPDTDRKRCLRLASLQRHYAPVESP